MKKGASCRDTFWSALVDLSLAQSPYDEFPDYDESIAGIIAEDPHLKSIYDRRLSTFPDECRRNQLGNLVNYFACSGDNIVESESENKSARERARKRVRDCEKKYPDVDYAKCNGLRDPFDLEQ